MKKVLLALLACATIGVVFADGTAVPSNNQSTGSTVQMCHDNIC